MSHGGLRQYRSRQYQARAISRAGTYTVRVDWTTAPARFAVRSTRSSALSQQVEAVSPGQKRCPRLLHRSLGPPNPELHTKQQYLTWELFYQRKSVAAITFRHHQPTIRNDDNRYWDTRLRLEILSHPVVHRSGRIVGHLAHNAIPFLLVEPARLEAVCRQHHVCATASGLPPRPSAGVCGRARADADLPRPTGYSPRASPSRLN